MGHNPRKCYLHPNCGVLGVVGLHVITHGGTALLHPSWVTLLIVQEKLVGASHVQTPSFQTEFCPGLSFRVIAGSWEDNTYH